MDATSSSGTDRRVVPAEVLDKGDSDSTTADLLAQKRVTIGSRVIPVGVLQPKALIVLSKTCLNGLAVGSAFILAAGQHLFRQFVGLLFGRLSRFAAVGAFGTVLNLVIMSVMIGLGAHYLVAAVVATELSILSNFSMHERLVFRDQRQDRPFWQRFAASLGFNNLETLVRMPLVALMVEFILVPSVAAQALTLAVAFLVRFAFTSRVIYQVCPSANAPVLVTGELESA